MFDFSTDKTALNQFTSRRNVPLLDAFPIRNLLFDPHNTDIEQLYTAMKRYSFRLVLRDIIKCRRHVTLKNLVRFVNDQTAQQMIEQLVDLSIVEQTGSGTYHLIREHVESFGDMLEWFIAALFKREFGAAAAWGVKLQTPGVGGDYDVIAQLGDTVVYVETKSSPPAHIEQSSMVEFCARLETIYPSLAIVLIDTHLRMKDKIVPMLEHVLRSRGYDCTFQRMEGELFHYVHRLYIINAKNDLAGNLKKVLADYTGYQNRLL